MKRRRLKNAEETTCTYSCHRTPVVWLHRRCLAAAVSQLSIIGGTHRCCESSQPINEAPALVDTGKGTAARRAENSWLGFSSFLMSCRAEELLRVRS